MCPGCLKDGCTRTCVVCQERYCDMCVYHAEGICFNCAGAVPDGKQKGGGTLFLQEQLSQDHPGRQLEVKDEKVWWFIQRQHQDEPSRWINERSGVMKHKDQVFEVYNVNIEDKVEEADHVKTNDETIKPDNLKKEDKGEL